MIIALLFRFAQAFGIFELVTVMTGGGPAGSTESVNCHYLSNFNSRRHHCWCHSRKK